MITGKQLRDAVISGANSILKNRKFVDDLNIFPVPDGDTGTNMSMTIGAGSDAMQALADNETTAKVAKTAASAMLRGARGNSGVILSLLFRGFSKAVYISFPAHPENGKLSALVPAWQPEVLHACRNTIQSLQALPEKVQIRDRKR